MLCQALGKKAPYTTDQVFSASRCWQCESSAAAASSRTTQAQAPAQLLWRQHQPRRSDFRTGHSRDLLRLRRHHSAAAGTRRAEADHLRELRGAFRSNLWPQRQSRIDIPTASLRCGWVDAALIPEYAAIPELTPVLSNDQGHQPCRYWGEGSSGLWGAGKRRRLAGGRGCGVMTQDGGQWRC